MDPQEAQKQAMHMFALMIPFMIVGWAVALAIIIIPFWQIFKKAGMSAGLSLLMALPIVNLVMLYVLAFSEWRVVPAPQAYGGLQPYPPPPPPANYPPPPTSYTPPPPQV
jgi:hypothetical protein